MDSVRLCVAKDEDVNKPSRVLGLLPDLVTQRARLVHADVPYELQNGSETALHRFRTNVVPS